ncbi:MAG: hypothetical protein KDA44_13325, partial [Planctomycetales bacterium]|nr:hypothetical protein [Planctomycetales bacterium]
MATETAPPAARGEANLRALAGQLEQHAGFSAVLSELAAGHGGTLGGVWGSSRALVAAALGRQCPGALVVVIPHARDIDKMCDDLALFTDRPALPLPAWENDAGERVLHDEIFGQRLRALKRLAAAEGPPPIIVTAIQSVLQPVPSREALVGATRTIGVGDSVDAGEVTRWLAERGCTGTTAVELPGEFALRGGILDVYPPDAEHPVRIELFGDEVESIRTFDVATQRSLAAHDTLGVTVLQPSAVHRTHLVEYLPADSWVMLVEPTELEEEGRYYHQRLERPEDVFATSTALKELYKFPSVTASGVPAGSYETTAHLQFESIEQFSGDVARVKKELDAAATDQDVILACDNAAEAERLVEVFAETQLARDGRLHFVTGRLAAGFRMIPPSLAERGRGRDSADSVMDDAQSLKRVTGDERSEPP